jgi:hypothetical protein
MKEINHIYIVFVMNRTDRRSFITKTATASAIAFISPAFAFLPEDETQVKKWQSMLTDPVYDMLKGKPDLDKIIALFPRPQGEPAFDPKLIEENIRKLKPVPEVNTGHHFLDKSIMTALAHIDATFKGNHPRYGVGEYGRQIHEGFPPVIISTVDALSVWGLNRRAAELFNYWLVTFVKEDGTLNYYGPSVSEYGQLLHTAAILESRAGLSGWWEEGFKRLNYIAEFLLRLHAIALKDDGLITGVPEADTRENVAKYFHNNGWVVKGLKEWADLCEKTKVTPSTSLSVIRGSAHRLKEDTLAAIRRTWPADGDDSWLPPRTGDTVKPKCLTNGSEASYTNYRYLPELLSSNILPASLAKRVINTRLNHGGQFCGMTRFMDWLDDWPLTDYLYGLWSLRRKDDFLMSLYGHIAYHQCDGHLTAYEQMSFPGDPYGSKRADYCLPSQLVAARAGRLINKT